MIGTRRAAQFWHRADPNVGDLLAAPIAEATLGIETTWVSRTCAGKLLGLGSIARHVQEGDLLAGCGSIQNQEITLPSTARVAWLRGPLTRRCLVGGRVPEVYGDPGLLLADVMPAAKNKSRQIGVIPHLVDLDLHLAARLHEDISIIDVRTSPPEFVQKLWACEVVLSSSLHGIVFAESYGIPALWITPHAEMKGGRFKFDDYYLGTGRSTQQGLSLDAGLEIARSGEMHPAALDLSVLRGVIAEVRAELTESSS